MTGNGGVGADKMTGGDGNDTYFGACPSGSDSEVATGSFGV